LLVEQLTYSNLPPWPSQADASGLSLHRNNPSAFGNDVANWRAAPPTPGNQDLPNDTDGDGLPNAWEVLYGLNPNDPADAEQDQDDDGATNREEYLADTNPLDPASLLRLTVTGHAPLTLQFVAQSNKIYVVEYQEVLFPDRPWQRLTNLLPAPLPRLVQITDTPGRQNGFYRLRVP
jgi:hypothetical protein